MKFELLASILSPQAGSPLVFPSGLFLWAFAFFALGFALVARFRQARKWLFIAFSLWFYWRSSGWCAGLLVATSIVDYWLARGIESARRPGLRATLLVLSLGSNLGVLGWFKYANFALGSVAAWRGVPYHLMDIVLPVGVSFYTFQSLSYTVDVWRGEIKALRKYSDFLFFVSFFPQLVAGPIVRAKQFLPQVNGAWATTRTDRSRAVRLILGGLLKKIVVADFIALNFVDRVFDSPLQHSAAECWLAAYGYAIQIYCDFSGYSEMAIGLALLFGFRLPDNFDRPYASATLTEFWRRWHMSLSSWLRDYLYIPLGGNRKGRWRTYFNLFLTMLLGGLWHGANWKFVLWGALHGGGLALEKLIDLPGRAGRSRVVAAISTFWTFHFVVFCWIFFRAKTFELAVAMIDQMVHSLVLPELVQVVWAFPLVFAAMAAGYVFQLLPPAVDLWWQRRIESIGWVGRALLLAVGIWIVIQVRSSQIQPFIYFQF